MARRRRRRADGRGLELRHVRTVRLAQAMIDGVFERSTPSDLIRGWIPVRVNQNRGSRAGTGANEPRSRALRGGLIAANATASERGAARLAH